MFDDPRPNPHKRKREKVIVKRKIRGKTKSGGVSLGMEKGG